MSKQYRIIETEDGFYIQLLKKSVRPKYILGGWFKWGVINNDKWVYHHCHATHEGLGVTFAESSVFKTLESAQEKALSIINIRSQ